MNDLEIAGKFAGLHGLDKDMLDTTHISRNALRDWVRDHRDALLSLDLRQERALSKFRRPDVVALVSEMRSDRMEPVFYLAVEASYPAEKKDIDKATDNAKILRAVTGLQAYPVVAAARLHRRMSGEAQARLYEDVDRYVAAGDGDTALWYRLDSANEDRAYPIGLRDVPADAPTFDGTNVPVDYLFTYWDKRLALGSFLMDFPEVSWAQALAALRKRAESEIPADSRDGLMGGMPVFRGTRVPVEYLFNQLRRGGSVDDFLRQYTTVKREDVVRVLESASELVEVATYEKLP